MLIEGLILFITSAMTPWNWLIVCKRSYEMWILLIKGQWYCSIFNDAVFAGESAKVVNTLRPRRNEQHFADDIFKRIFFNENVWISIKISLKFVPKGPINNIPELIQIMAWRRSGDKPLSEPMMVSLPTHICVTRPQWVNHQQYDCKIRKKQYLSGMVHPKYHTHPTD